MKYLLIIGCLILSNWSFAKTINESIDASSLGGVDINNLRGIIVVEGWDKSSVEVTGNLDDVAEDFVFKSSGENVLVHVLYSDDERSFNNAGSRLKIMVPKRFNVEYQGVSTNVTINDIEGNVEIANVSGNVSVLKVKGELSLNSVSGKIDVKNIVGNFAVTTVSGDLVASIQSADIMVNAVSADVMITGDEVVDAVLSNVSGDTQFTSELLPDANVSMSNVTGESVFQSVGNLNAKVILQTGPGGDIENKMTDKKPTVSFIRDKSLTFSSGNGSGRLKLTTVSGTVAIE